MDSVDLISREEIERLRIFWSLRMSRAIETRQQGLSLIRYIDALEQRLAEAERELALSNALLKDAQECNVRYAKRNGELHIFIKAAGLTAPQQEQAP